MKNTLGDLNLHLFETLERLNDEELKGDKLEEEIRRATAISRVACNIVNNANVVLKAEKFKNEVLGESNSNTPKMLEG